MLELIFSDNICQILINMCEPLWGEISPGLGLGNAERDELCKLPQVKIIKCEVKVLGHPIR